MVGRMYFLNFGSKRVLSLIRRNNNHNIRCPVNTHQTRHVNKVQGLFEVVLIRFGVFVANTELWTNKEKDSQIRLSITGGTMSKLA